MRWILIFFLFFNTCFAQSRFVFEIEENYLDYTESQDIFRYKTVADSLWSEYKKYWKSNVELRFKNDRFVFLHYFNQQEGWKFIEYYEDTIAFDLTVNRYNSNFILTIYNWYWANTIEEIFWSPEDNILEYTYYGENETLLRTVSHQVLGNTKTIKETTYKDGKESTKTNYYYLIDSEWELAY